MYVWCTPRAVILTLFFRLPVNYGMLLLQALFEHWPETHGLPEAEKQTSNHSGKIFIILRGFDAEGVITSMLKNVCNRSGCVVLNVQS